MSHLTIRLLFRSPVVSIRDVRCRPVDAGCGSEEWTPEPAVVFPRSGVFVRHVGRRQVVATPNDVLFFSAGEPYRVSHPLGRGDDCTSFTFAPEVLREAIGGHDPVAADRPGARFAHLEAPVPVATLLAHQRLRQGLRSAPPPDALEIEERAVALLADALGAAFSSRGARAARPATEETRRCWVNSVRELLAGRPEARSSLAELARAVACSPFHLSRVFRLETGMPIHRYRLHLRLALAVERLLDGEPDLTRLALDLGFSSHSHFTAAFRRGFGVPPSAVRTPYRLPQLPQGMNRGARGDRRQPR
jgi:AraC-like DNA-binding protein